MHERKNAASMDPTEISKFMNALLELKKKPAVTASGTPTNVYDQFVAIHDAIVDRGTGTARGNGGHGGPAFCSWHREYILRFEQQLQIIDSDVFLPYWSWESGNASDTDSIFVDEFMGPRERITSGYLSETRNSFNPDGWKVDTRLDGNNSGTRLTRNSFSGISTSTASAGRNSVGRTPFTGANGFRNSLEGAHNSIHGIVGGHMTAMTSPNDPIFFLHHANVDRLWAEWQLNNPGDANYPSTSVRAGHALNDLMWPWDGGASQTNRSRALPFMPPVNSTDLRRPRDVLDITTLGYSYEGMTVPSTPPPSTPPPSTPPPSTPPPSPNGNGRCFIATAAYGSELEPPVQFLREFRDDVVLKSRFQKPFEDTLNVYYKISPPIANLMIHNKPFKYTMKYSVVWPFVALTRATAFVIEPFVKHRKQSEESN